VQATRSNGSVFPGFEARTPTVVLELLRLEPVAVHQLEHERDGLLPTPGMQFDYDCGTPAFRKERLETAENFELITLDVDLDQPNPPHVGGVDE
jgi:hypothetical protein